MQSEIPIESDINIQPQNKFLFKFGTKKIIVVFFLLLMLFTVIVLSKRFDASNLDKGSRLLVNKVPIAQKITDKPRQEKTWVLRMKTLQGNKDIFEFEKSGSSYIYRWRDSLIFAYPYGDHKSLSIFQHNLITGETKTIFKKETDQFMMSELNIIDGTLYFSLGAYLKPGESYWMDLNSKEKSPHKLTDTSGDLTKIKGHYFFIKSEGDSCWGESNFSLIDLKTKYLTPVADTRVGCVEGQEYLGINDSDQMILADHNGGGLLYEPIGGYNKIILIPLTAISQQKNIAIPKQIIFIKYLENKDELLFIGAGEVYIYSFKTNDFRNIVTLPNEWIDYKEETVLSSWNNKTVCIEKSDERYTKIMQIEIDLEKMNFLKRDTLCPQSESISRENKEKTVGEIFKDLKLSSNYSLMEK